jgi:hypothetical protein
LVLVVLGRHVNQYLFLHLGWKQSTRISENSADYQEWASIFFPVNFSVWLPLPQDNLSGPIIDQIPLGIE